jgi:hypothetical protein
MAWKHNAALSRTQLVSTMLVALPGFKGALILGRLTALQQQGVSIHSTRKQYTYVHNNPSRSVRPDQPCQTQP